MRQKITTTNILCFDELSNDAEIIAIRKNIKSFIKASYYHYVENGMADIGFGKYLEMDKDTEVVLWSVYEVFQEKAYRSFFPVGWSITQYEDVIEKTEEILLGIHKEYLINHCKKFEYYEDGNLYGWVGAE